ncbi:MAG: hypothetical protein ACRDC6_19985 [Shewanella sp.]
MNIISCETTMNSLDFLNDVINPARKESGEAEVQNAKFVSRVEDELDDLTAVKIFHRFGNEVRTYDLTMRQMLLVGMRESKSVRRSVLAKLEKMQEEPKQTALPADCVAIKKDDLIWLQGEVIERMKNQLKYERKNKDSYKAKLVEADVSADSDDMVKILNYFRARGKSKPYKVFMDRKEIWGSAKAPTRKKTNELIDKLAIGGHIISDGDGGYDVPRQEVGVDIF